MPLSQVAVSCFPFGFDKLLLRNATGPAGNSWFTTFHEDVILSEAKDLLHLRATSKYIDPCFAQDDNVDTRKATD